MYGLGKGDKNWMMLEIESGECGGYIINFK